MLEGLYEIIRGAELRNFVPELFKMVRVPLSGSAKN
jgi:hypothetical protein